MRACVHTAGEELRRDAGDDLTLQGARVRAPGVLHLHTGVLHPAQQPQQVTVTQQVGGLELPEDGPPPHREGRREREREREKEGERERRKERERERGRRGNEAEIPLNRTASREVKVGPTRDCKIGRASCRERVSSPV